MRRTRSVVLIAGLVIAACTKAPRSADDAPTADMTPRSTTPAPPGPAPSKDRRATVYLSGAAGEVAVRAEVVATEPLRQRGLMYREHLPPDDGMLFLFPDDDDHGFWMKNTLISLDMIWIDKDHVIIGIVERTTPKSLESRHVAGVSRYVLEVNAGWCAAHGVRPGTKVRFEGVDQVAQP